MHAAKRREQCEWETASPISLCAAPQIVGVLKILGKKFSNQQCFVVKRVVECFIIINRFFGFEKSGSFDQLFWGLKKN